MTFQTANILRNFNTLLAITTHTAQNILLLWITMPAFATQTAKIREITLNNNDYPDSEFPARIEEMKNKIEMPCFN